MNFPTLLFHRLFPMWIDDPEEKTVSPLTQDSDLDKISKVDLYKHGKHVREFALWLIQIVCIFLLGVFVYEIIHDYSMRKTVVNLIVQNVAGLSYAGLTVAGITISNRKNK